ncbi:MAG: serine/threonine protein kinase [Myxococcales bacterium]|nr:serine/threonine protein kinase [Myxococcales bacterium]
MNPRVFGRYVLLDSLAAGGMGEVFSAIAPSELGWNRFYAVKKILPALGMEREFRDRFQDEARLVGAMSHPGIVAVHEMGRVGRDWFMAMELVEGRDAGKLLSRCWRSGRKVPIPVALDIVRQLLLALDYAHRQTDASGVELGLVHRDISPANVLLSWDGTVKLADFGLALSRLKLVRTQPHVVLGKPGYIAPERLTGGETDRRADIFCAGVLLFELLTTERFTAGRVPSKVLPEIHRRLRVPPSKLRAGVPREVDTLLARALAIEPRERYQSAREFCRDLQCALVKLDPGYGPWAIEEFLSELFHPTQERRRLRALAKEGFEVAKNAHAETERSIEAPPLRRAGSSAGSGSGSGSASRRSSERKSGRVLRHRVVRIAGRGGEPAVFKPGKGGGLQVSDSKRFGMEAEAHTVIARVGHGSEPLFEPRTEPFELEVAERERDSNRTKPPRSRVGAPARVAREEVHEVADAQVVAIEEVRASVQRTRRRQRELMDVSRSVRARDNQVVVGSIDDGRPVATAKTAPSAPRARREREVRESGFRRPLPRLPRPPK